MKVTYRPIENFPGKRTGGNVPSPFRTGWGDILDLLENEMAHLGASEVVLQLDLTDSEIRMDGMPRKDARPRSSAVVVSFESDAGPLLFATDEFPHWHNNLYAIARGMEALRKLKRYGIVKGYQQYTGWKAIGGSEPTKLTYEEAHRFVTNLGGHNELKAAYRIAVRKYHPDNLETGDEDMFKRLQAAWEVVKP